MVAKPKKKEDREIPKTLQEPKGMHDVLPVDEGYWSRIEGAARELADAYGFRRIDTPILEFAEVFRKTEGEASDVFAKEMYTLKTRGGDLLALRPEHTPPVMRAYLGHSLGRLGQPQKLFSMGPVFRHDNPQFGRYRQFTQFDFDVIGGSNDPIYDAQVILLFLRLFAMLKVKGVVLKLNSIGCRVCQPLYRRQLVAYYRNHEKKLCQNCIRRAKTNPLRLLDCKEPGCAELREHAPNMLDKLCATCSTHFKGVLEYMDELKVSYVLENTLVRGLDYYSRTVFEIFTEGEGKEAGALAGGGRYDYLAEFLGGHATPGVGCAASIERIIPVMKAQGVVPPSKARTAVFVAHAGDLAKRRSFRFVEELRRAGIHIKEALAKESLKAQLKSADREEAHLALIFGQKEIYEGTVIVRDLKSGLQETVSLDRIVEEIKKRLR
ncbi:MAG: histidine--tRNA ligase [Candidatus Liptonbacteria bacterium]|nr:histidine--tRNA ligase [Candidatus Liptonbacteria bacterium]